MRLSVCPSVLVGLCPSVYVCEYACIKALTPSLLACCAPCRTFAECWVFCLMYKSLECVAVEFEPDVDKAVLEDVDKGTCYIQRRSSATIAIAKDPHRHVFMLYSGEGVEALSLMNLPTTMRVRQKLLRYHSACDAKDVNGVCVNTYGSHYCMCAAPRLATTANASCVEPNGFEIYTPPSSKPRACPFRAVAYPGSTKAEDCICMPGHEYRNSSAAAVVPAAAGAKECARCEAGMWSYLNSTCKACYPNSWSLQGKQAHVGPMQRPYVYHVLILFPSVYTMN
jgi:hypothetical protein